MDGRAIAIFALLLGPFICSNGAVMSHTKSTTDTACIPVVRVKRYTAVRAVEMSPLKMTCQVKYCEEQPVVSWCKLNDQNICIKLPENPNVKIWQETVHHEENLVMSYMEIFRTTKNDSGEYRCGLYPTIVGHSITVTVVEIGHIENSTESTRLSTTESTEKPLSLNKWLPYVLICVGIVTIVALVMLISFLSLHGCKRSSRIYATEAKGSSKAKTTENTVQEQVISCPTRRPSGHITPSPIVPKRDRSLRLHPTQSPALRHHPVHDPSLNGTSLQGLLTLPRAPVGTYPDSDPRSATMTNGSPGNAGSRRPSQVLYATLDHLAPKDSSRTQPPKFHPGEEFSEYASIRVS